MTGAGIAGFSTAIFAGDSGNRGSVATAGAGSVTLASLGSTCSEGTTALATGPAVETAGAISIVGAEVATGTSVTGVTAAGFAGTGVTPSDDGMLAGLTAMFRPSRRAPFAGDRVPQMQAISLCGLRSEHRFWKCQRTDTASVAFCPV
ncbi:MAG: hypothetical protein EBT22_12665 [Chloroflexi bacterium]|nr:hypothetical protein [Chloroflexota bacterium]